MFRKIVSVAIVSGLGLSLLDSGLEAALASSQGEVKTEAAADYAKRLPKVIDRFEVGNNVYVRALKADPDRNSLWVGTSAGVHEVALTDKKVRQTFTRKEGLANEYVFAIGIDHRGNKWFGTNSGGASRYRDGVWKTFFPHAWPGRLLGVCIRFTA